MSNKYGHILAALAMGAMIAMTTGGAGAGSAASGTGPSFGPAGSAASGTVAASATAGAATTKGRLPEPTWQKLPRWRGFNLLGLFYKSEWSEAKFTEEDFQWISEWGFNFVRLPMDYRYWIKDGDWRKFDEETLKKIDQAVAWGKKYNIHVLINFHRAPGYTVAQPSEAKSLWTDPEAQEVCALHWRTFARRYKGIPSRNLSFNLFNEPSGTDPATHAKVVKMMVDAIRKEDPKRLVVCDSLNYGNTPSHELLPMKVAIATRGYSPFQLTHYGASWVGDNSTWPVPTWPILRGMSSFLYATDDPESGKNKGPLIIKCDLKQETELAVTVHEVSSVSLLAVSANGKRIFEKAFKCGPGQGEWKEARWREQWQIWCNLYDKAYTAKLPAGTTEVRIENADGDWMTISGLSFKPFPGTPGGEAVIPVANGGWGSSQGTFVLQPDGKLLAEGGPVVEESGETLWKHNILPFKDLESKGFGVMVGEWGAYNPVPHAVHMRWAEDCLKNWQKANWGWAVWEFRGSFGVLDSDRKDVQYEEFRGHKLDREFLELLKRY